MPKDRNILIFENPFTLSNFLLKKWFELAYQSIEKNDLFTVAFPGGKTPVEFYCKLSGDKDYDQWDKTHIFLTDERFVDPEDDANNFKLISNSLLNYIYIPDKNLHRIHTYADSAQMAAECYEEDLINFFKPEIGKRPCFDLILLGIGDDGHIASLFPGEKQIEEKERLAVSTEVEKNGYKRISLTLPVINHARHVILLATGKSKADILRKILHEQKEYPARKVMPANGEILFLIDKDAASQLPQFSSYTHYDEAIVVKY